jgi:hypothetical protein
LPKNWPISTISLIVLKFLQGKTIAMQLAFVFLFMVFGNMLQSKSLHRQNWFYKPKKLRKQIFRQIFFPTKRFFSWILFFSLFFMEKNSVKKCYFKFWTNLYTGSWNCFCYSYTFL